MFWRRKREERERLAWAAEMHPPISNAQRNAALDRQREESGKRLMIDFGDGQGPVWIATGRQSFPDLRLIYGYGLVLAGYDRWGWPVGSPDSPDAQKTGIA